MTTTPATRARVRESADGLRMARGLRRLSGRDDWAGRIVRCAVIDALEGNGHGRLVSIEGAPPLADLARQNLARSGIGTVDVVTGRFRDALPPVLERLQPLEFAYIDGHHDGRATLDYLGAVLPAIRRPALLVFDDIGISPGMRAAWEQIARHPRVTLAVDLRKLGVCGVC